MDLVNDVIMVPWMRLVVSLLLVCVVAGFNRIPLAVKKRIGASFVSVGLLSSVGVIRIAHADDVVEMTSTPSNVIAVTTSAVPVSTSLDDEARIQRKLAKQRELSGGSANDGSYMSSIKKEQTKQKAQKRTKAQKAKDLCENLGRGC